MDSVNNIIPVNLHFTTYEPIDPKRAANKCPIIFIHGLLSTPNSWNKVRNAICEKTGRKAYAIGLRNHWSSGWSEEFSIKHMVADLKNFMMKENISKAILISHSLGAKTAITLALEEPGMVEKVVVEEMNLTLDEGQVEAFKDFVAILRLAASSLKQYPSSLSEAEVQKKLQQLFTFSWSKKPTKKTTTRPITPLLPFHKDKSGEFVWDINVDAITGTMDNVLQFKICLSREGVNLVYPGKALFIGAEYSRFDMINDKEVIQKHFPNSKVRIAEGVFHSFYMERPNEYIAEISEFIGA